MKMYAKMVCAIMLCALCGCATVTRGTKEVLVVESEPIGATVTTSIGLSGATPATFKVSRKGGFTVTIEKEGYEPVTVQVGSQVAAGGAAGMAGNLILGGLIGAAVDAGSGAMKELKPNPINVKLVPLGTSEEAIATDSIEGSSPNALSGEEENSEESELTKEEQSLSFRIDVAPLTTEKALITVTELDKA